MDCARAIELLERTEGSGNSKEVSSLAVIYEKVESFEVAHIHAIKLYERAIEQDDPKAQNNLPLKYGSGVAVDVDYTRAI